MIRLDLVNPVMIQLITEDTFIGIIDLWGGRPSIQGLRVKSLNTDIPVDMMDLLLNRTND